MKYTFNVYILIIPYGNLNNKCYFIVESLNKIIKYEYLKYELYF